jgi:uncharacterized coiled-coil protein SlyX
MKTSIPPVLITFALVCFALVQSAQAVSPAPDGGFPGGNTAEGQNALLSRTTGGFNTAVGWFSLRSDTVGAFNTAIGAGTLLANTADQNTATGAGALLSNTTGSSNTADGAFALFSNTTGQFNTANGGAALQSNTTGNGNTANGAFALLNNTTGSGNTALGGGAGSSITTANNVICIGGEVGGANVDNTCFIGNIRGVTTQNADAIPVLIDSAGQLGTVVSSERFKKDISNMEKASEAILSLRPVTFHYKTDKTNRPEFGLIAEEVAEVNPNLVVRDKDGKIYTVRYDAVNAMLLNEFLKEHRKVQEQDATIEKVKSTAAKQEATIVQQQRQIEALTAGLQKVSAQVELNKAGPQTVVDNHQDCRKR